SSILGSGRGSNATRCDPLLVALVSVSNCTTSTCLLTYSGGAFRLGTRSHPGTATRSAAPTSTGGYAFFRRPMLPNWPCSTPHQTQTRPLPAEHLAGILDSVPQDPADGTSDQS